MRNHRSYIHGLCRAINGILLIVLAVSINWACARITLGAELLEMIAHKAKASYQFAIQSRICYKLPHVVLGEVFHGWGDVSRAASYGIRGVNTAQANGWKRASQMADHLERVG